MSKKAIEPQVSPLFDYRRCPFSLGLSTPDGIWLSAVTASQHDRTGKPIIITTDVVKQSCTVYEKIETVLKAAGLGFKDVVQTVDYVTASALKDYPKTAEMRQEIFGTTLPAISTVVVNGLLEPGALIAVEVTASRREFTPVDPGWSSGSFHQFRGIRGGDILYIPAQLPVKSGTEEIVGVGDIVTQARQIYENAWIILQAAGLGWEHIVKTVDFLALKGLASYRETGSMRKEYLSEPYPAATGIIMDSLPHSEALLQVEFIASSGEKEIVNPGWLRYNRLTYVPAVKTGKLIFLSGQGAVNPETGAVEHPGDIVGQTQQVYSNLQKVLEAAGAHLDDLVKITDFVTPGGLEGYQATNQVRRELFSAPYPSTTTIVCEGLLRPEMLIEVDAIAVLD